ncbi:substrate-binding domain-containing protein [Chloroflexota bacterium]
MPVIEKIARSLLKVKKTLYGLFSMLLVVCVTAGSLACNNGSAVSKVDPQSRVRIATTTSLYDTGLWAVLEPMFEKDYGVELDVLYAGTGIAIEYGKRGDVDAIAVHSKSRETAFVADGYGVERVPFAYNYFVIVGPADDPAGIGDLSPEDAFDKLFTDASSRFISRGDDSGTHGKEKAIWAAAGYDYDNDVVGAGTWYVEAGSGMGATLQKAKEMEAYTLSDMGTFLAYQSETGLEAIVDEGSILLNVYSVLACDPDNTNSRVNLEMGENLVAFLTSEEIQDVIGEYGVEEYGRQLFTTCAGNEPTS